MPSGAAAGVPEGRAAEQEPRRPRLLHVWLLDAEAAAAAAARSSSSGGRMLGQQQLYSSAALLTGERSRLLTCYVQDYLECVESLPHDMQRNVSVLRELDNKYQGRGPQGARASSPDLIRRPPDSVAQKPPGEVALSISPVTVSPSAQTGSGVWDRAQGLGA